MTDLERLRGFSNVLIDTYLSSLDMPDVDLVAQDFGLLSRMVGNDLEKSGYLLEKTPVLTGENDKKKSRTAAQNSLLWAWVYRHGKNACKRIFRAYG